MARKKSIADMAGAAVDEVLGVKDAQDVSNTDNAQDTDAAQREYIRLNLRVPKYVKEYLQEASFKESTPTRRVSVTAYLVELVDADMKKHGVK